MRNNRVTCLTGWPIPPTFATRRPTSGIGFQPVVYCNAYCSVRRARPYPTMQIRTLTVLLVAASVFADETDRLSPSEAIQRFTVAKGLQVTTFASDPDIVSISNIDVDARGRVWACECVNYRGNNGKRPEGDRILILEDSDGDGVADKQKVFYQGRDIDIAMGLCVLGDKKAIVACTPDILLLEDADGDGKADKKTVLFTSDGVFQHDHSLHSFVFGPDGRFYGNFGNTGRSLKRPDGSPITDRLGNVIKDDGRPYHGGIVFRTSQDFDDVEVLGHNFRNNYEATVDSFGNVWQSDNDDDGNLAVRLNYLMAGGNYGYLDELTGERWRKSRIGEHPDRGKRHWHQNDPGVVPNVVETGNGAPTGVTVYEGDLLPEAMRDQVFFCDAGPHVVWSMGVTTDGAGFKSERIDILRSTDNNFRPIDVAVAPDGSLFVSDWYDPVVGGFRQNDIERGRIYWIAPEGHRYDPPKYDFEGDTGIVAALRSPNYAARSLAYHRARSLGAKAEEPLQQLLQDRNPRIRARALWILAQIPGREVHYVETAVRDRVPDVRIVGLRIADMLRLDELMWIERLSEDPSPRVRAEAAIILQHHSSAKAAELWGKLAGQHDGNDRWYLEALGIGARGKWDACLKALERQSLATGARNDIVWTSRGKQTTKLLGQLIQSAERGTDLRRYVRAFDFQPNGPEKDETLTTVAFNADLPAEIAFESAARVSSDKTQSASWADHISKLLSTADLNETALKFIRHYELDSHYPRLLQIAGDLESDLRLSAATTLLDLKQHAMIREAFGDPKLLSVALSVAQAGHDDSLMLLWPFLFNDALPLTPRKEAARALCKWTVAANAMLEKIEADDLNHRLRDALARPLLTHSDGDVRARAEKLFPQQKTKDATPLPKLSDLIAMKGDAKVGAKVFVAKESQCAKCHPINGKGRDIGPDLGEIGTKLTRAALFEAILYPSAAISHNYEMYVVLLVDGQTSSGLLVNRNDREIQLRDAEGNLRTFDMGRVESVEAQDVSLMPANLHQSMTAQQLVDLVEYMRALRGTDL